MKKTYARAKRARATLAKLRAKRLAARSNLRPLDELQQHRTVVQETRARQGLARQPAQTADWA